jgi:alanine racemase
MARPNRAGLDLDALRHNLAHARKLAPDTRVMAVIKANAYGHGAVTVANCLAPHTDAFAVACIEEALELRQAGISVPILLLEGVFQADELSLAAQHNFWLMIDAEGQLRQLEAARLSQPVHCWLKVDSGMHRLGIAPDNTRAFFQRLKNAASVQDDIVLCTHFACADELDSDQTKRQIEVFDRSCEGLSAPQSCANSPGILGWPESHRQWIRPGYMLYGNSPFGTDSHHNTTELRPVMTLSSAIISLREVQRGHSVGYGAGWTAQRNSRIATVTIGYGDGYPRSAKNGTPVLVNGQRASLAGRVSMDMITVDVTDLADVEVGDEVTLWGPQLPIAEVAQWADTIGYELTTRMPARTPRVVIAA